MLGGQERRGRKEAVAAGSLFRLPWFFLPNSVFPSSSLLHFPVFSSPVFCFALSSLLCLLLLMSSPLFSLYFFFLLCAFSFLPPLPPQKSVRCLYSFLFGVFATHIPYSAFSFPLFFFNLPPNFSLPPHLFPQSVPLPLSPSHPSSLLPHILPVTVRPPDKSLQGQPNFEGQDKALAYGPIPRCLSFSLAHSSPSLPSRRASWEALLSLLPCSPLTSAGGL